ncbi:MAG: DNA polymerase III subunit gamma/tau [Chloroflexota bacterium]
MSLSLYRKYRSQTFDELVGQEPVVKTLKNAIATGRIGHAFLFTGPRGVGKTSAARLLARAANCLSDGPDKPCNECANCVAAGRDIATDLIEIDAASNTGVDNIRELIERAQFSPSVWRTKWYIIDEVHMLSVSAFNALLKTLEEPPPHVSFILATTEIHKVPATVASRCQRFDFRRVPLKAMVDRLSWVCKQEDIEIESGALELVARQSTGSLRDALSLMDQLRVFSEGKVTLAEVQDLLGASGSERVAEFVDYLLLGDLASGLRLVNAVLDEGLDIRQFNRQTVEHLRQLMLIKSGAAQASGESLIDVTEEMRRRMEEQATKVGLPDLLRWTKVFADADSDLRSTTYRQLPLEMALVAAILPPAAEPAQAPEQRVDSTTPAPVPERPRIMEPDRTAVIPPRPAALGANRAPAHESEDLSTPPPMHVDLSDIAPSRGQVVEEGPSDRQEADGQLESTAGETVAGDELGRLKQLWPHLLDQINARSKGMAAVFRDPAQVHPFAVLDKTVTISFRYPIHAQRATGDAQRKLLEQALSNTLGHPCLLETITFEEEGRNPVEGEPGPGAQSKQHKAKEKRPAPYETPRGRAVMNTFGVEKFEDD